MIMAEFNLDTKNGMVTEQICMPYGDLGAARDKMKSLLEKADPMIVMRDAETGEFVFIHTMKLASVKVYKASSE